MRYGTWTTIDCPTGGEEILAQAYTFLSERFDAIDGSVRKVNNPHDFGTYPSFEIDAPYDKQFHDTDECEECPSDTECIFTDFVDKANAIERDYSDKFTDNL